MTTKAEQKLQRALEAAEVFMACVQDFRKEIDKPRPQRKSAAARKAKEAEIAADVRAKMGRHTRPAA